MSDLPAEASWVLGTTWRRSDNRRRSRMAGLIWLTMDEAPAAPTAASQTPRPPRCPGAHLLAAVAPSRRPERERAVLRTQAQYLFRSAAREPAPKPRSHSPLLTGRLCSTDLNLPITSASIRIGGPSSIVARRSLARCSRCAAHFPRSCSHPAPPHIIRRIIKRRQNKCTSTCD